VILERDAAHRLPAIMAERGWSTAVAKPVVSASAHDTLLVPGGEALAVAVALASGRHRMPVIVQPFLEAIRERGEWSLVFVDGRLTHAVVKRPAPGDFRVQPRFGGIAAAATPSETVAAAAARALDALPRSALYARVDGVETADGFVVMEVELNEPGLFFVHAPEAVERFADAVVGRL
jgi:glutathione synthase/RimK-type ligase-like ATP-grasp enzyme